MLSHIHLMSESEKTQRSNNIFSSLQKLMSSFSGAWGCFQSLKTEPQIEFKMISDIDWCYPKTQLQKLSFYSGSQNFKNSEINVLEPTDGKLMDIEHLSGICVPGLAFHQEGYRLGRGKGFYDQTFSQFLGTKIGICFDFCISKDVPYEDHDLKMDYIVTDKKIYSC